MRFMFACTDLFCGLLPCYELVLEVECRERVTPSACIHRKPEVGRTAAQQLEWQWVAKQLVDAVWSLSCWNIHELPWIKWLSMCCSKIYWWRLCRCTSCQLHRHWCTPPPVLSDLRLMTIPTVPLLFSPEDTAFVVFSEKNFTFLFVWPQNSFLLFFGPPYTSIGPDKRISGSGSSLYDRHLTCICGWHDDLCSQMSGRLSPCNDSVIESCF